MPIYAYRCTHCGHAQDVLQKMSDPVLTVCPACGQSTYAKQLTAAGFQLKGSGWYVTDFRDGKKPEAGGKGDAAAGAPADAGKADAKPSEGKADSKTDSKPASAPAPSAATPAASPAPAGKPSSGT